MFTIHPEFPKREYRINLIRQNNNRRDIGRVSVQSRIAMLLDAERDRWVM